MKNKIAHFYAFGKLLTINVANVSGNSLVIMTKDAVINPAPKIPIKILRTIVAAKNPLVDGIRFKNLVISKKENKANIIEQLKLYKNII